jgi:putative spermidine/putrescine transport system substrate-binding protein
MLFRSLRSTMVFTVGAVGVLALAACSGSASTSASSGGPSSAAGAGTLTFTSFGGAYQDAQRKAMLGPYAASSGLKITEDQPTDYPKLTAMVKSGNVTWDVVDTDPFYPLANCGTYAEKIDTTVVDTSKMPKELVSDCAVPSMTFSYVLMYNSKLYGSNPPKSWADFFDTKNFPGKRALQNASQGGGYEVALLADGVAPDKLYPLDYDRAFKKLDTLGDNLIFWETGAQSQEMMEKGEVGMLLAWNGRAYNAAKNGAPYLPQWNQNIAVYDVFMVPKGVKNKDAAMKFIAYATGAEAQARLTENIPYAPINSDAQPKVDALTTSFLPTGPDAVGKGIIQDQKWWSANNVEATKKWSSWVTR